jgi:hypothetical protein
MPRSVADSTVRDSIMTGIHFWGCKCCGTYDRHNEIVEKNGDVVVFGMPVEPIRGCLAEKVCSFAHSLHLCGCAGWLPLRRAIARRLHRRLACGRVYQTARPQPEPTECTWHKSEYDRVSTYLAPSMYGYSAEAKEAPDEKGTVREKEPARGGSA